MCNINKNIVVGLACLFCFVSIVCAKEKTKQIIKDVQSSQQVLTALQNGASIKINTIYIEKDPNLILDFNFKSLNNPQKFSEDFLNYFKECHDDHISLCLTYMISEINRNMKDNQINEKLGIMLSNKLSNKNSGTVKNVYIRELLNLDFPVNSQSKEIMSENIHNAILQNPQLSEVYEIDEVDSNILLLLGKIGKTAKNVDFMKDQKNKTQRPLKKLVYSAMLSQSEVKEEQDSLINKFIETTDLQDKYTLAYTLSLWGEHKAQVALAEELRTPGMVQFSKRRPPEMIRLHIAIALVRTIKEHRDELPVKGCYSWNQEDYAKIEQWATKYLNVTWSKPEPPYSPVQKVPF